MTLIATNVPVPLSAMLPGKRKALRRAVAKAIGADAASVHDLRIVRKSVDARKKGNVHYVVSATFKLMDASEGKAGGRGPCPAASRATSEDGAAFSWPHRTAPGVKVQPYQPYREPVIPDLAEPFAQSGCPRPLVVGAGPAGLFCALWLARAGMRPIVVERGPAVEERAAAVDAFNAGGPLDPDANIQFGEGGAGAFSDGKLTCGKTDPNIQHVLHAFVDAGAPDDILVDAKPHIGTDYLPQAVRGLREAIEQAGGDVRFNTQLSGIVLDPCAPSAAASAEGRPEDAAEPFAATRVQASSDDVSPACEGCIRAAILRDALSGEEYEVVTDALVLAIGHSARDTFRMLQRKGALMQRKPFAVGVRIEHPQQLIDRAQYGTAAGHPALPAAEYKLNARTADDRGVYTFCMCPGGTVVAAASQKRGVCTNGMSNHARDGRNANSALLVEVRPDDLPGDDALAGVAFQESLERAAYDLAQEAAPGAPAYAAPAQTVGSFLGAGAESAESAERTESAERAERAEAEGERQASRRFAKQQEQGSGEGQPAPVNPTYPRGVVEADLRACLPPFVADSLAEALPKLDRKLRGFADPNALMTAVEARSSSPVRIVRDRASLQSERIGGLYPAGEGAGYAGGIMSAATDGIRVAEAVMRSFALRQTAATTAQAIERLREGGAVIFPTDTVAGVGVAARFADGPGLLYDLKARSGTKPVSWLVGSAEALRELAPAAPAYARRLAEAHWPGPLTLVVPAAESVPPSFTSGQHTLGLRMPDDPTARALIDAVGPIATTSANPAGEKAPTTIYQVDPQLMLAAGCTCVPEAAGHVSGIASTVVDCTGPEPRILREGGIPAAAILSTTQDD